ncbi:uncharacterized protein LOC132561615 isoform X1 [Ylistrum balloti]|uniref:uncharacterized protein LOC132561615 isoform X1 n=1 Tax=Ylistrum balloti TaxID=509963 RepID=UPI002905965B|nr:uncharacterized protein LOC132561615 isoform X1 [Ylistrum balloti]
MQRIIVTTVILGSLATVAWAGMCVVCRSDRDSGCGETMDMKIVNDYAMKCNSSVCDKRVNDEIHKLVIRQCGSDAAVDEEYFSHKCKELTNIKVCKCKGDMCNGQSQIRSSLSMLTGVLLVVIAVIR